MPKLNIDVRSLRYVIELARTGNFHRAADALFISQPALSKRIQHIETMLGVALFDRVKGGVVPTAYGNLVLGRAKRIMRELDGLESELAEAGGAEMGCLLMGCGPHVAQTFLPQALIRFSQQAPKVEVNIVVENTLRLTSMLRDGELDFFIADVEDVQRQSDLAVQSLPSSTGMVVCRRDHPLASEARVTPGDLLQYPLATASLPSRALQWLRENAPSSKSAEDFCRQVLRLSCDSHELLLKLVQSSDYLTVVPRVLMQSEPIARSLRQLQLVDFTPLPPFSPGIVAMRARSLSPAARLMLALLTEELAVDESPQSSELG